MLGRVVLPCLIFTAMVGTVHMIFPAALLFLYVCPLRQLYRVVVDAVAMAWLTGAAAAVELLGGVKVTTSGDAKPPSSDRGIIIVLNHHCRLDWMFFWCCAVRLNLLRGGALKIALKDSLKKAPFFGWAMQAFLFTFLSRNDRAGDLARLRRAIEHCAGHGDRLALLIFPEGTDLSPSNQDKAKAFAKDKGLTEYRHVLHPRAAGFAEAVNALGGHFDAVYDVTVSYTNHPTVAAAADPRPSEVSCLLHGKWPRRAHFHIERVPAAAVLSGGAANVSRAASVKELAPDTAAKNAAAWLTAAWAAKEARLAAPSPPTASCQDTADVRMLYLGTLSVWTLLVATIGRALFGGSGALWLFTIAGAGMLAGATRRGGLDEAEFSRFSAAPAVSHAKQA